MCSRVRRKSLSMVESGCVGEISIIVLRYVIELYINRNKL
jgi:hypothetical protein